VTPQRPPNAPPAFHLLAKPTGAACNLECAYYFFRDKRDTLPRYCLECDVRFACHGECPKNRFVLTPDGEPGLNYLCPELRQFFHHIAFEMKLMAGLVRRGREAREVMAILDRAFADVNDDDPCPCGSGRRFADCHAGRRARDPS